MKIELKQQSLESHNIYWYIPHRLATAHDFIFRYYVNNYVSEKKLFTSY